MTPTPADAAREDTSARGPDVLAGGPEFWAERARVTEAMVSDALCAFYEGVGHDAGILVGRERDDMRRALVAAFALDHP